MVSGREGKGKMGAEVNPNHHPLRCRSHQNQIQRPSSSHCSGGTPRWGSKHPTAILVDLVVVEGRQEERWQQQGEGSLVVAGGSLAQQVS
jgi:hypothetical protein